MGHRGNSPSQEMSIHVPNKDIYGISGEHRIEGKRGDAKQLLSLKTLGMV